MNIGQEEKLENIKQRTIHETQQEIEFVQAALNLPCKAKIMDLYCGYGRHAVELAKLGYCVTGVDSTEAFIDIARQKADKEGVKVSFHQYDMRELPFIEQFDAVINMFAAFGYYSDEENHQALQLVARALRPKGLFLIDLLNRDWLARNNITRYWRHPDGDSILSYKIELKQGRAFIKRQLLNQVTGEKIQYEFALRAYSFPELSNAIIDSGFDISNTYGGFDFQPYNVDSPRMIIIAQKK